MKGRMDNAFGTIVIDNSVIAKYAGSVAVECFGIVGMASVNMKDGIVSLLKRDHLEKGINVQVAENRISIVLIITPRYPVRVRKALSRSYFCMIASTSACAVTENSCSCS